MSNHPFQKFLELVEFDQQLIQLIKQTQHITEQSAELALKVAHVSKESTVAQRHWESMRRAVDEKELHMRTLVDTEKQLAAKLEAIQNPKEYAPLKKELDHVRAQQHEFESELLSAWQQVESAERDFKACVAITEEKVKHLEEQAAQKTKELQELTHKRQELNVQREQMLETIPAEWRSKYVMMQSRVANPVVAVVNGSCGGCNFQVSPQDMTLLRKRALVQCKECYRLLYVPEVMTSDAGAA